MNFSGEPESFDVVTAFNVLLYLSDRDQVLEKIWSLLKPGGVFISATDCLGRNFSRDSVKKFVKSKLHLMPYVAFDAEDPEKRISGTGNRKSSQKSAEYFYRGAED